MLSQARGHSDGMPEALVYTEVVAMGRDACLADDPEDLEDFVYLIYKMDEVFIQDAVARRKRADEAAKAPK